ncbi:MAG: leucine-rich repeat protein [Oscillospiraceae bacterium]|nr:leucine-rich repeat protein [Oscillospiraceae bacterium]
MQEEIIHYAPFTDETEIRIPEGVRQIGEKAFEDLPHVTRIDFPATVTDIYPQAIDGLPKLRALTLPDGACAIDQNAFFASSIEHITIPAQFRPLVVTEDPDPPMPPIGTPDPYDAIPPGTHWQDEGDPEQDWRFAEDMEQYHWQDMEHKSSNDPYDEFAYFHGHPVRWVLRERKKTSDVREGTAFLSQIPRLREIAVDPANHDLTAYKGALYTKDRRVLLAVPPMLEVLEIPPETVEIAVKTAQTLLYSDRIGCFRLREIRVHVANTAFATYDGALYDKALTTLFAVPYAKKHLALPSTLRTIVADALRMTCVSRLTLPDGLVTVEDGAFGKQPLEEHYPGEEDCDLGPYLHTDHLWTLDVPWSLTDCRQSLHDMQLLLETPIGTLSLRTDTRLLDDGQFRSEDWEEYMARMRRITFAGDVWNVTALLHAASASDAWDIAKQMPPLLRTRMMPWLCRRWPGYTAFPQYLPKHADWLMTVLIEMDDLEGIGQLLSQRSLSPEAVQRHLDDAQAPAALRAMLLDYAGRYHLLGTDPRRL